MRWKTVLGIIALIVLVAIAGIVIFLKTYDWNRLKPQITRAVYNATGRELVIEGDIQLDLGFIPGLVVEEAKLQNAPWGSRPVMARIERLELEVALFPLLSREVDVKRLILQKPDILVEKNKAGKTNLEFTPPDQKTSPPAEEPQAEGGTLPVFNVNRLAIFNGLVTYKDLKSDETYRLAVDRLEAAGIGAEGNMELALEAAYNDRPFTVSGRLGSLAAMTDKDTPSRLDLAAEAGGVQLKVEGTVLDLMAAQGIELAFAVRGDDIARLEEFAGADIPFEGPISVSGKVVDKAPKIYQVREMEAAFGDSRVAGTLGVDTRGAKPLVTAKLVSERFDLKPFLQKQGRKEASEPEPAATRRQTPPAGAGSAGNSVFPSEPLPTDTLTAANADVEVRVAQFSPAELQLGGLALKARLEGGTLTVSPFELQAAGGAIDGVLEIARAGGGLRVGIKADINNLEMGRMLDSLDITKLVETLPVQAAVDLRGQGSTVDAIMGSLTGQTRLQIQNGLVRKELIDYLEVLDPVLQTMLARLFNLSGEENANLEINCLVSRLNADSGRMHAEPLVLDTPYFSVVGAGTVNLQSETYDLLLRPIPKQEAVKSKRLNAADLSLPFRVKGPLNDPKLALAKGQAALELGKRFGGEKFSEFAGIAGALLGEEKAPEAVENPCLEALKALEEPQDPPRAEGAAPTPDQKPAPRERIKEEVGNILQDLLKNRKP